MLQVQNEEKPQARGPFTVFLMSFWNITVKSDQLYDGQEIAVILSEKRDDVNLQRSVNSARHSAKV